MKREVMAILSLGMSEAEKIAGSQLLFFSFVKQNNCLSVRGGGGFYPLITMNG